MMREVAGRRHGVEMATDEHPLRVAQVGLRHDGVADPLHC